jgi:lysophospholipase L1-like esterase
MRCLIYSLSSIVLFVFATPLSVTTAFGQSLSIRKGESNYWVEASAPTDNPHTLQASENLNTWIDVRESVQETYSLPLNSVGVGLRYFRLIPSPAPAPPIRILLLGDSMASDCCGWGGGIYGYFKPNATVINYAMPWTSTRIFLQSAEFDKMLLVKPDYVLLQYGFIDGGTDPDRATTPQEFVDNLKTIVDTVRSFNGIPILVTLHAARVWDGSGNLYSTWEARNNLTKQVAAELQTPLIDFYQITFDLFSELGLTGTAFMHWTAGGPQDVMHFSQSGAQYVSRFLVNALPANFAPYLTGILDPPPIP